MTPSDELQMVVWIEDEAGNYVDTAFITQLTGKYGLGNRPGMMEFNSAYMWPYGRRTTTFPIWSGRQPNEWPVVEFQNGDDTNLSHPLAQSSIESFFCRPIREGEPMWDAQSCATTVYTDKGVLSDTLTSKYPPRADLAMVDGIDHPSVADMSAINQFDTVSRATPPGGQPFSVNWAIPEGLPNGNYVAFIEVSKEYDFNDSYNYPAPVGIPWAEYGIPYRGQPSVVYSLPFSIGDSEFATSTMEYIGYGDPDGIDNNLRVPDSTISSGVAGSGSGRLLVTVEDQDMYRIKLEARPAFDDIRPGAVGQFESIEVDINTARVSFIAPGDDDQDGGTVTGYEIRYRAGTEITEDNFRDSDDGGVTITPAEPGTVHEFVLTGLLPNTNYYIGIRAFDECLNPGELQVLHILTPVPEGGSVDACFVATAAYGSLMANDVKDLRRFRDVALRSHIPGELLVEGYYTFGPALAALIQPSDTMRRAARVALEPLVEFARDLVPAP